MPEKLDFITPAVMKAISFFCSYPMQEFHEREVMRKAGLSKGSANKILRMLAELDILTRERKGRMVFYRLNVKNPVVKQFKILFNVFSLRRLVSEISAFSKKIVLFGSCSEGTDVKESDIDLFILALEKNFIKKKISEFNSKGERQIVPIIVDANEAVKLKKEDKPLYERIERGIILWEKE
jgi:predicted nucleotidyltransferase